MRAPLPLWPAKFRGWLPGLLLSVPLALLLWNLRTAPEDLRTTVATAAVLLALPWVVPAMVLVATVSAPLYMWLHTQGPVPDVLQWLGGTLLVGAVLGAHVNATLAWLWLRRDPAVPEPGLRDFLERSPRGIDRQLNEDKR
jgi:hypothetical protein